jgi:hypothetical protein
MNASALPPVADGPFAQHAHALAWLDEAPDPLAALVGAAAAGRGWRAVDAPWTRLHGAFTPHADALAVFVYGCDEEPGGTCLVELFARARSHGAHAATLIDAPAGRVRVAALADDPALSTLAQVFERHPRSRVLRYRPHRRCTLHVPARHGEADRFVKVFAKNQAPAVHAAAQSVWQAQERGELGVAVARPLDVDAALRSVTLSAVPGVPVMQALMGPQGPQWAGRLGHACAGLACSSICDAPRFTAADQMARTARYVDDTARLLPALQTRMQALQQRLQALHEAIGERAARPIHGSPHAHQWLQHDGALGLVDFDRFCLGDPELDVATFVGEMDFVRGWQTSGAELAQAFVRGYEARHGELHAPLVAAYRAHKRLAKVRRAAYTPSLKAPEKALRHLQRAEATLDVV